VTGEQIAFTSGLADENKLLKELEEPNCPPRRLAEIHDLVTVGSSTYDIRHLISLPLLRALYRHPNLPTRILLDELLRGTISAWLNPATPLILMATPSKALEEGLMQAIRYAMSKQDLFEQLERNYPDQVALVIQEEKTLWKKMDALLEKEGLPTDEDLPGQNRNSPLLHVCGGVPGVRERQLRVLPELRGGAQSDRARCGGLLLRLLRGARGDGHREHVA
jgi:hypothetical protein